MSTGEYMTYFLKKDSYIPSYAVFPRYLFRMEISETAKLIYVLLLDRARLSMKNEGWVNEFGHNRKPELHRYTELADQIKEKTKERKALLKEKKDTPIYRIITLRDLSRRISELTEDLEELKSEKELILQKLNCTEDSGISSVQKDIAVMESQLKKLQAQEAKYAAELDKALQEYKALKATNKDAIFN